MRSKEVTNYDSGNETTKTSCLNTYYVIRIGLLKSMKNWEVDGIAEKLKECSGDNF